MGESDSRSRGVKVNLALVSVWGTVKWHECAGHPKALCGCWNVGSSSRAVRDVGKIGSGQGLESLSLQEAFITRLKYTL